MYLYSEMVSYLKNIEVDSVKGNDKIEYLNIECGFDIETTSIIQDEKKFANMYIWQIGIGYQNRVFYGRTWTEFIELCNDLVKHFDLSLNRRLVVYIHNLGYEFQFMRKWFTWVQDGVFSVKERVPIKALCDLGIEFRDSQILSGASLEVTARNLATHKIRKLKGDLDYSLTRHHKTELTPGEVNYCINDIQIILAYINEQIAICGDITRLPMTSTGRVRDFVRKACYRGFGRQTANKSQWLKYRRFMDDLTLTYPNYHLLSAAYMGGFVHSNAMYTNFTLYDVSSYDFTSSYPSVMVSEKFPMTKFKAIEVQNEAHLAQLCSRFAVVFEMSLENVESKILQENYLSEHKCHNLQGAVINNGRIVKADSLSVTLTNVDYDIMVNAYSWGTIKVRDVYYASQSYLPKPIIQATLSLYQDKTTLKGVEGSEVEYLMSKGMLNSVYGMCVTNVIKDNAIYSDSSWSLEKLSLDDRNDRLTKSNESKNRFLYYPWGIWISAYARRNLWTGILAVGEDYVYSDTDSLKLFNHEAYKEYFEWFDKQIIDKMTAMCNHYKLDTALLSPKNNKGETKMMGVWDYEGTYKRFKTLGAKRYMVQDGDKVVITVAGLSKQNGVDYMLEQCSGNFENVFEMFDNKLYIPSDKTGKMTHTYIDNELTFMVTDYNGVECEVTSLSSIHLESCEFTLSQSEQYFKFIDDLMMGYVYTGLEYGY